MNTPAENRRRVAANLSARNPAPHLSSREVAYLAKRTPDVGRGLSPAQRQLQREQGLTARTRKGLGVKRVVLDED